MPLLREAGADIRFVTMHRTPWSYANALALPKLRRLIHQVRPDAVHGHSSIGGLLARVAATGSGVATVYTPNGITPVRAGLVVERALRHRTDVFVAVSKSEGELAVRLDVARPEQVVVIPNGIEVDPAPPPIDLRDHLGLPAGRAARRNDRAPRAPEGTRGLRRRVRRASARPSPRLASC